MNYRNYFTILIIFSSLFSQEDRSTIYHNGSPIGIETANLIYQMDSTDIQYSNVFTVYNDYFLERLSFYLGFEEYPDSIFAQIYQNDNQSPGELIDEWQITINENYPNGAGYNVFTVEECIHLDIGSSYWVTIASRGNGILKWFHTDETWPNIYSENGGDDWSTISNSPPGANIVYGEQIYYQDPIWGDVNEDLIQNVIDVIQLVQFVLNEIEFSENQFLSGDLNQDGLINIVDIIGVVNIILDTNPPLTQWLLEDINTNSSSYEEMIGPETYLGDIGLFYFGKAG
jgi:hypothetical protein